MSTLKLIPLPSIITASRPAADPVEHIHPIEPMRRPVADPVETGLCGRETLLRGFNNTSSFAVLSSVNLRGTPRLGGEFSSVLRPPSSVRYPVLVHFLMDSGDGFLKRPLQKRPVIVFAMMMGDGSGFPLRGSTPDML